MNSRACDGRSASSLASRTPEIFLPELMVAGITTVVGCLGVDTTTRTMPDLLPKARGLREEGLTALVYTGGYPLPPATLTGSIRSDIDLARLPVHTLKIDRVFIAGMLKDDEMMAVVQTIISLAHSLSLETVAEGVETEEQADVLALLRCERMQGYLVSRPLPPAQLAGMLGS